MPPLELIVVIPAFNEEACIEGVIRAWLKELEECGLRFQIIAVNDGSRDATGSILDRIAADSANLKVRHKPNGGHGSAILEGYKLALESGCEWVFQVDSDDQFEPRDFKALWQIRSRSKFVLGCREVRNDPLHRLILTNILRLLILILFGSNQRDTNIPYRLMHRDILTKAMPLIPKNTFAPNIFLSLLAAHLKEPPYYMPVTHRERKSGKLSLLGWRLIKSAVLCAKQLIVLRLRWCA